MAREVRLYTAVQSSINITQPDLVANPSYSLSLDLTKEKIAESGRGLVFTDTTARLFWQDNKVRYRVVIQTKS